MPTPVRELALAAVKTALDALSGVRVYRNRAERIVAGLPAVNLVDGGQRPNDETFGVTIYRLEFVVQGYVDGAADAALGPALSDLQARVVAALLGNVTLDGRVIDTHEGDTEVSFDRGEGRAPVAMFETAFTADFWTREGDPYTAGP